MQFYWDNQIKGSKEVEHGGKTGEKRE